MFRWLTKGIRAGWRPTGLRIGWIATGLETGIVTTRYPKNVPNLRIRTVPRIDPAHLSWEACVVLADVCPTGSLACRFDVPSLILDYAKCIGCGLCAEAVPEVATMTADYQLAARDRRDLRTDFVLEGVLHGR